MPHRTLLALALLLVSSLAQAEIVELGDVDFSGDVKGPEDLSAVQKLGNNLLILASDETIAFQVLEEKDDDRYEVTRTASLLPKGSTEIDMEALAYEDGVLYVLGSHSWARKAVEDDKSQKKNRRRLETLKFEASRDHLFRVKVDPDTGQPKEVESTSLRTLFANHPILHLFAQIPSKENGIDFEGLAVQDGKLYLGFRGPVLRGNYVPVLSFAFDDRKDCSEKFSEEPEKCRLLYVDLSGRGIRSLHSVTGGFLLVAGPMGDGDASYQLYFWDGTDCVPQKKKRLCELELLGEVPTPKDAKAEGLAVLEEDASDWEILVVYDGAKSGTRFEVKRP